MANITAAQTMAKPKRTKYNRRRVGANPRAVDEATVVTTILSNNQRTGLCGSAAPPTGPSRARPNVLSRATMAWLRRGVNTERSISLLLRSQISSRRVPPGRGGGRQEGRLGRTEATILRTRRPTWRIMGLPGSMGPRTSPPAARATEHLSSFVPGDPVTHRTTSTPVRCVIVDDNRHFLRAVNDVLSHQGIPWSALPRRAPRPSATPACIGPTSSSWTSTWGRRAVSTSRGGWWRRHSHGSRP